MMVIDNQDNSPHTLQESDFKCKPELWSHYDLQAPTSKVNYIVLYWVVIDS